MNRASYVAIIALLAAGAACAATAKPNGDDPNLPLSGDGEGADPLPPPRNPDINNDDAGAFGIGNRGKDGGATEKDAGARPGDAAPPQPIPDASTMDDASDPTPDASSDVPDASTDTPDASMTPDASAMPDSGGTVAPPGACPNPLGAGDLAVVELMIASQVGSGDKGEWVEIQSTQNCALNLNGLHLSSPRGSGEDTADITADFWLPANGIFVVANSADATVNHDVPAPPLFTWNGSPGDVLKNDGDTVTLSIGGTVVDNFVYPALQLYSGVSISFPADCAWSDRSSFARWSYSAYVWSSPYQGTPNKDNTDVACY